MANSKTSEPTFKRITNEFIDAVFRMPRFSPAWFAFSFMPLLYIRNLGQNWYQKFMPAIVAYGIGAALLGTIHRLIALSYEKPRAEIIEIYKDRGLQKHIYVNKNNEMTIPLLMKIVLYLFHFVLFGVFVWYLNHCGIICI